MPTYAGMVKLLNTALSKSAAKCLSVGVRLPAPKIIGGTNMRTKNNTHPINQQTKRQQMDFPQEEKLICPVCGKTFEPDYDTKYIASGGYTCSWNCFLTVVKRGEAKKKEKEQELKNKIEQTEIKPENKVEKTEKKTRKRKNNKK